MADSPAAEHVAVGRRVGSGLADELERRVATLRRLDDVMGGTVLHPIVRSDLEAARTVVLEGQHTPEVRCRLLRVVGELSQLGGWVYADAGRYTQARQVYLDGVSAASEAGDRPLAGQLLSTLSYLLTNTGSPRDAVLLARSALKGAAHQTPPVVRALLGERIAWAAANSGDADASRRALADVDDEFDRRRPEDEEPDWTYWLSRDEVDVMRALRGPTRRRGHGRELAVPRDEALPDHQGARSRAVPVVAGGGVRPQRKHRHRPVHTRPGTRCGSRGRIDSARTAGVRGGSPPHSRPVAGSHRGITVAGNDRHRRRCQLAALGRVASGVKSSRPLSRVLCTARISQCPLRFTRTAVM